MRILPSPGLAVRRRPYASWSMRPPRSTKLGFQPPAIGEEEIASVVESLRSGWITTGPKVLRFEEMWRERLKVPHAVALNSATAGLHVAMAGLDIGPGDEVITTSMTWPSTVNVTELLGAKPVQCALAE